MHRAVAIFMLFFLSACAGFPELDARRDVADRAEPWPVLVPVGDVLAEAGAPGVGQGDDLAARLAGLRARAADLRAR